MRKISRLFKIYFVPTQKKKLPLNNHPTIKLENFFENQFNNYKNKTFNLDVYKILKKNFKSESKIRFLDYGGENLDLYLFLKEKFPKIKIMVVNQVKVNLYLQKVIINKKVKFIKVIKNMKSLKNISFDFIHFGSSLQYIKNYEKILNLLLKNSSVFFYISATGFFYDKIKIKEKIIKQVNLLPVIMYCYIINFNYLKALFKTKNFKISLKKSNSYKKINFKNFEMQVDYLNILFKRNI